MLTGLIAIALLFILVIISLEGENNKTNTKNMEKYPLIRKIYLYLFALVGLSLMVIAGVQFINMGLKMWIFKQADLQQAMYQKMPTCGTIPAEKLEAISESNTLTVQLTQTQKDNIDSWVQSYKAWQEEYKNYDPVRANREQTASNSLAMLIVGLPLYLYHWTVIKRDTKKEVLA